MPDLIGRTIVNFKINADFKIIFPAVQTSQNKTLAPTYRGQTMQGWQGMAYVRPHKIVLQHQEFGWGLLGWIVRVSELALPQLGHEFLPNSKATVCSCCNNRHCPLSQGDGNTLLSYKGLIQWVLVCPTHLYASSHATSPINLSHSIHLFIHLSAHHGYVVAYPSL